MTLYELIADHCISKFHNQHGCCVSHHNDVIYISCESIIKKVFCFLYLPRNSTKLMIAPRFGVLQLDSPIARCHHGMQDNHTYLDLSEPGSIEQIEVTIWKIHKEVLLFQQSKDELHGLSCNGATDDPN